MLFSERTSQIIATLALFGLQCAARFLFSIQTKEVEFHALNVFAFVNVRDKIIDKIQANITSLPAAVLTLGKTYLFSSHEQRLKSLMLN